MNYTDKLPEHLQNPEALESIYRQALQRGEEKLFREAVETLFAQNPSNLLLAAWHYRLAEEEEAPRPTAGRLSGRWLWAVAFALLNGLAFWWLSDMYEPARQARQHIPFLLLYWAPIAATCILGFLYLTGNRFPRRLLALLGALALVSAYAYFADFLISRPRFWQQYLTLGAIHLIPLAWSSVAIYVLKGQADAKSRVAFLAKSLEAVVLGGLSGAVLGIFTGVTLALFSTLNLHDTFFDQLQRVLMFGGAGCIPVLAVAAVYEPLRRLREQTFAALFRITTLLLRVFLLPSILILLTYVVLIPFHFTEPFYNREALIAYNVMLFAVVALLMGTTPVEEGGLSPWMGHWLRRGRLALAVFAEIISLYALAAIIFRTWWDGFTPNRITVIGWNLINIALLGVLLIREWRSGDAGWVAAAHRTFAQAMPAYAVWSLLLMVALPLLFARSAF